MPSRTYPNGRIPASQLAPVHGGGRLLKQEAMLYNALSDAWVRRGHARPAVNGSLSGYRDYTGQVAMKRSWCARGQCGNAATPGTSNHGRGHATDNNTAAQQAIREIGAAYGMSKAWSDAPWEPWHVLVLVERARRMLAALEAAADPWARLSPLERRLGRELRTLRAKARKSKSAERRTRVRRTALRLRLTRQRKRLWRYANKHGWTAARRERYAVLARLT